MTAPDRDPLATWFTHGEYDDHDWSSTGSPTYCRGCHITFPAWQHARAALAPRPPETADAGALDALTPTERIGALVAADPEAFDWVTAMAAQKVLRVVEDRVNGVRGNGYDEPRDPALDWVLAVIHEEERKTIEALRAAESPTPEPGEAGS